MLERIELNYFKKHEHLTVDFAAGLNGIVGKNYHGKSTILQGVLFCLGGARMVPGVRLQTRGTNSGFKQRLWFSIAGKGRFLVERTKNSANLTLLEHGAEDKLMASGASPVNAAMADLLGMPLRRFAQIKYAKQKAADAILKYGSTELFKIVTEITGLERIGTVLERITVDLSVQRKVVEVMPEVGLEPKRTELASAAASLEGCQFQLSQVTEQVTACSAAVERLQGEESALRDAVSALFDAGRMLRRAEEGANESLARQTEAESRLEALQTKAKGMCDGDWEAQEAADMARRPQLQEEERSSRTLASEVSSLTREVAGLQAEEEALAGAVTKAEAVLQGLLPAPEAGATEAARERLQTLKSDNAVARSTLQQAKQALESGACHACHRPFEHFDCAEGEAKVAEATGALAKVAAAVVEAEQLLGQLESKEQAWNKASGTLEHKKLAAADFASHASKSRNLLAEKSLALSGVPGAEALRAELETIVERLMAFTKLRAELDSARKELAASNAAVAASNAAHIQARENLRELLQQHGAEDAQEVSCRLEVTQNALSAVRKELQEANAEREKWQGEVHRMSTAVQLLEQAIASGEENNAKARAAQAKAQQLEELQQFIRKNRDRYSKQVWDVFMASASQFASSSTGGVIEALSRGDDGAFTFIEEGFDMALEEGSGAQLAIIGCAVQMALADAAQSPLNILLMDEPTADMDPEHALAFSSLLAASGKQVVLVTHRELDGSVFDHSIAL